MRRGRWAALATAVIAAGAVAAGCGLGADEPPDPQAVVGAACAAAAERGAVDVSIEGESSLYGDGPFRWTSEAEIDGEDYRLLAVFEEIGASSVETVRAGDYIYARVVTEGGEEDEWTLQEAAIADRDRFPYPLPLFAVDPAAETCERASASAFRYVGEETINGGQARRFTVDFAAQYFQTNEITAPEIEGELRDARDFWIDADGRIAQVRADYFAEGIPYFFDEATVSVAVYSNFGEPNAISAPPNVTPIPTPTARPLPTPGP